MIIEAASASFQNMFAPRSRVLFFKIIGMTLLVLLAVWAGFQGVISEFFLPFLGGFSAELPNWLSWLSFLSIVFAIFAAIGSALALALLIAPISAIVSGFFIDQIADDIEEKYFPQEPRGTPLPTGKAIAYSIKFLFIVLLGNLLALLLLFIPGVNLIAFFLVNGYLLGREYFEFAALRHHDEADAKRLRSRHSNQVFLAGLLIAGFLSVPILNLLTPFFAAGLMVFLHKKLVRKYGSTT